MRKKIRDYFLRQCAVMILIALDEGDFLSCTLHYQVSVLKKHALGFVRAY